MNKDSKKSESDPPVYTFYVDPDGNITGSHHAHPDHYIIVRPGQSGTYPPIKIYAQERKSGRDGTEQLVGQAVMSVGVSYKIHKTAGGKDYQITTTKPPAIGTARPVGAVRSGTAFANDLASESPDVGSNGDLYVGSGG